MEDVRYKFEKMKGHFNAQDGAMVEIPEGYTAEEYLFTRRDQFQCFHKAVHELYMNGAMKEIQEEFDSILQREEVPWIREWPMNKPLTIGMIWSTKTILDIEPNLSLIHSQAKTFQDLRNAALFAQKTKGKRGIIVDLSIMNKDDLDNICLIYQLHYCDGICMDLLFYHRDMYVVISTETRMARRMTEGSLQSYFEDLNNTLECCICFNEIQTESKNKTTLKVQCPICNNTYCWICISTKMDCLCAHCGKTLYIYQCADNIACVGTI